ncbi:MAG: DeoR/GlpR family DNA-binding transcription regulator [Anaerolineae bacterium]|jgi:DeoR/GlpR family transcriptional regulator of sugar metabolism
MLAEERLNKLINILQEDSVGRISELAEHLGVSSMTIRRDLDKLESKGLVRRIFGGAVIDRDPDSVESSLDARWLEHQQEKTLVGAAAARLIQDGDKVILDAGSTTLYLAKHLHGRRSITLVTHSLPVLWELTGDSTIDLVALGGEANHEQKYFYGPLTESALRQMRIDKVFLGIHGIQAEHGLSERTFTDIPLKRIFMDISRELIVLADSSKIGKASFFRLCDVSEVDKLVTDASADREEIRKLEQAGLEVIVACGT